MMSESHFDRVDDDDPQRCQAVTSQGQCHLRAIGKYCLAHGGSNERALKKKQELKNYRLTKFRERTAALSNSEQVHNLQDEVGILRIMVEEKWNACQDSHELMMQAGPLADLVGRIDKLVCNSARLQEKAGNSLDKSRVMQFAHIVVEIIGNHIEDEEVLNLISDEILTALGDI